MEKEVNKPFVTENAQNIAVAAKQGSKIKFCNVIKYKKYVIY